MSASTEKKNRKAAREAGTDKKLNAKLEQEKAAAKTRRKWIIGTVLVAILIIAIIFLDSGFLYTGTTALKVGSTKYSPAELRYCYADEYWTMYRSYGNYLDYYFGLDTSNGLAGLDSQECMYLEGGTWKDYFLQTAEQTLQQLTALSDYARANGIALTEEEIAETDAELAELEAQVVAGGYKDLDAYFSMSYGNGVSAKVAREMALLKALGNKAYEALENSFEYSDAELEEHYASFEGSKDCYDYIYYSVAAETSDGADASPEVTEEALAAALDTAEAVKAAISGSDADAFNAGLSSVVDGAEGNLSSGVTGSSISSAYSEWMIDASRKAGDVTVAENTSSTGYYVVMFLNRSDNHYPTVSMRHVLIRAEAEDDGTYSEVSLVAAHDTAMGLYETWKAGEATEESFAALANENSDDSGSNTNGGLYEDIYNGQMVAEINDWLFEGRSVGDTKVIDVQSAGYSGTHIVYFTGEGMLYSNYLAKTDLVSTAVSDWLSAAAESHPVTHGGSYGLAA